MNNSDEKENAANLLSVTNGDAASSRRGSFLSEDATKRDTMVMVVDQSEEKVKKKTKKGKKVKIAGMTNGGCEETLQDGAVIEDPEILGRFEVGWQMASEGVLTVQQLAHDSFTRVLIQPKWPMGSLLRVLMTSKTTSRKVRNNRKQ